MTAPTLTSVWAVRFLGRILEDFSTQKAETLNEYRILQAICDAQISGHPLCRAEIAERLNIPSSTVSDIILSYTADAGVLKEIESDDTRKRPLVFASFEATNKWSEKLANDALDTAVEIFGGVPGFLEELIPLLARRGLEYSGEHRDVSDVVTESISVRGVEE